jgi:hypothetical protein
MILDTCKESDGGDGARKIALSPISLSFFYIYKGSDEVTVDLESLHTREKTELRSSGGRAVGCLVYIENFPETPVTRHDAFQVLEYVDKNR